MSCVSAISGALSTAFSTWGIRKTPASLSDSFRNGGTLGRWFFTGLAAIAAIGVLIYLFRAPSGEDRVLGACAMLLAGIIGNMTDRFRFGYVIDFIDVFIGSFHWPTFNVADSAICAGAFLLLLDIFLVSRKERAASAVHSQKPKSI
ncbi:MAG: signal peptidase II [Pyrinomonadaceae bacterium]